MTEGILTTCYGNATYRDMAVTLARSLAIHCPDTPRIVVTDRPDDPVLARYFDEVVPLRPEFGDAFLQKLHLHRYTTFDRTLYIDSDSLVLEPLDHVWDAFRGRPFGVVGFDHGWNHWFDPQRLPADRRRPEYPIFNGGLFYFEAAGAAIFDDARSMLGDYDRWGIVRNGDAISDEALISIAMACAGLGAVGDQGRIMRTLAGVTEPIRADVFSGVQPFHKYEELVRPAIIHFAAGGWRQMEYRREALRLALHDRGVPRGLLAPLPPVSRAVATVLRPLRRRRAPTTSLVVTPGVGAAPLYLVLEREWSGAETVHGPVLQASEGALVACPAESPVEEWMRRTGVATVPLRHRRIRVSGGRSETIRSLGRGVLAVRDVRAILRAHPDRRTVIGTSIRPSVLLSLAALGLRGRHVIWTVTDLLPPGAAGTLVRIVARLTRPSLLATSHYIAEGSGLRDVEVSWPGVDPPDGTVADRDPDVALLVGHISPTKRTDFGVDVALKVGARHAAFRLDVVGRAQYRPEDFAMETALRARAEEDPVVARHVRFVGHDPEVRSRLAHAGLLLHCRDDEPFGMVLIEAMAAGLPVVAPSTGGPAEIVEDGVTGLLYPPDDPEAAAGAVLELLRDPERARALGEAGRRRVRERFATGRQVDEWLAFQRAAVS